MNENIADRKRALRRALSAALCEITPETSRASGRRACRTLVAWEGFARARQIAAFSSLPGEIDTQPILDAAHSAGKTILLPRMVDQDLEFAPFATGEALVAGRFDVLEPGSQAGALPIGPGAIVLVPGIAFDAAGGRLGRGAGYYDRALGQIRRDSIRATFIGLGFSLQIVQRVPMSSADVEMNGILTETGLIWCGVEESIDGDRVLKGESGSADGDDGN